MNIFFSFAFNFILFLTFFFFFFVLTFLIHRIGYLIYDIFFAVSFPVSPLKYIYIYIHSTHVSLLPFLFRFNHCLMASNIFRFLISLLILILRFGFSDLCLSRSKFRPRSRSISLDRSACCCSFVPL